MIGLRPAEQVLTLARMGCYHQTRLSFMRSLLRLAAKQKWQFTRAAWQINAHGVGHAVYAIRTPYATYSLVAFAHDLPDELRSDRVIAEAWDATFALLQGEASEADIKRLAANVPRQEAGRVSDKELCLSRANRSERLWQYCLDCLAEGQQPEAAKINETGYLMRTTAVYGNAKFGSAQRAVPVFNGFSANDDNSENYLDNPQNSPISAEQIKKRAVPAEQIKNGLCPQIKKQATPAFRIEMLCVWLIRCFSVDLLEAMAENIGGDKAVKLDESLKRSLGIGNSTGLGMAPFIMNHPTLIHHWVEAREQALLAARQSEFLHDENIARFGYALQKSCELAESLHSENPMQIRKNTELQQDLQKLSAYVDNYDWRIAYAGDALYRWGEAKLSLEGQEMLVSLLIETVAEVADRLAECMHTDETQRFFIDGGLTLAQLQAILDKSFAWCEAFDFTSKQAKARFWYVSTNKLEPRLGERYEEDGSELELPLATAYNVMCLKSGLSPYPSTTKICDFLLECPEYRHIIRRVLHSANYPYAEIRDNILSANMHPADLLRFKLSFFGATRFDLRSDRWVRINMYQNAPFPCDIGKQKYDQFDMWVY